MEDLTPYITTSATIEGYLVDMSLEEFIEFLEENQISYSKMPRFPIGSDDYIEVFPNDHRLRPRQFFRDHKQIQAA